MIFYFSLAILLIFVLYCGQVIGMLIYCENCSELKEAKAYVYLVPIVKVAMIVPCINDCFKEKKIRWLITYLMLEDKNVMILCAIVDMLPELRKIEQRSKVRRMQKHRARVSPMKVLKSLLFTDNDFFTYGVQIN